MSRRTAAAGAERSRGLGFPAVHGDPRASVLRTVRPERLGSARSRTSRARRARGRRDRRSTRDPGPLVGAPSVRDSALVTHPRAPLFPRHERPHRRKSGAVATLGGPSRRGLGAVARPPRRGPPALSRSRRRRGAGTRLGGAPDDGRDGGGGPRLLPHPPSRPASWGAGRGRAAPPPPPSWLS